MGCPSCYDIQENDIALIIKEIVQVKVKMISILLIQDLSMRFVILDKNDLQVQDFTTLDTMIDGVLIVGSTGNYVNF